MNKALDNWPREEARMEAEVFLNLLNEEDKDYCRQWLIRTRAHWVKVFNNDADMASFSEEFNNLTSEQPSPRIFM